MIFYALVLLNLLGIITCHIMARKRGLNPVFWGLMGGIFDQLAIPFIFSPGSKSSSHVAD